ncbi:hypothetical protein [Actinophytocola gossypii]|uniref:DUF308 domain-containing protein n=1 Tax=Actinophytocola gossypii TaxID=2812003 RepID=A0ABT2J887_9PSEU|nr:hypothetical protein [Actinophytocola gossypii]MCT2584084.1 hypothetical protein [Actinophytocola gossypii]
MPDRPEDVDAAFAEIVAGLEREGVGSRPPQLDDPDDTPPGGVVAAEERAEPEPPTQPPKPPPTAWRGSDTEWDWTWGTDEDHYVPPEPPPLPRLRPMTIVALVLIVVSVVLLIVPGVIGLAPRVGTPIALIALTCGGVLLLLRVRKTPEDPNDGRDDGAQI